MEIKLSVIIFSIFIAHTCAQKLLDDVIRQVFNNPSFLVESTTKTFELKPIKKATVSYSQRIEETKAFKSCGAGKECVPRHLCVDAVTGENFIDIHLSHEFCSYSEICCDNVNKRNLSVIPDIPKKRLEGCGWLNVDGIGFKVSRDSDNVTLFGEFPWMAAILRTEEAADETIYLYQCGGSIIAPNVVLTSAHCVNKQTAHNMIVRGGEWDTQNDNEVLSHVDRLVKEIVIHENFNKDTLYNDVALLILEEPFEWQETIQPVCIPQFNANFDNSRCFVSSWSKNKIGVEGKYLEILGKFELPVVPHDTCQNYLRQTRLGFYFNLHESFLCAGGEKGKDTCIGGGGSPLVCPMPGIKNRYYQAGIVAWGIGCGGENIPGVYANVAYLRPWISDKLTARGITFNHFTP